MRSGLTLAHSSSISLADLPLGGALAGTPGNATIAPGAVGNTELATGIARNKLAPLETPRVIGAAGQPALSAGWSAFEPCSFWLDPTTGGVLFAGILKRTGAYTSGGTVLTLPAGYRPTGSVNRDLIGPKFVASLSPTLMEVGPSGLVFFGENLVDQTFVYLDSMRPLL